MFHGEEEEEVRDHRDGRAYEEADPSSPTFGVRNNLHLADGTRWQKALSLARRVRDKSVTATTK